MEFIMSKNKEPIILSKDKIRRTYITLDTIHTQLTPIPVDESNNHCYVTTYRVADVNIDVSNLKHEYTVEQFIYRITGMRCDVYDSMIVRACICLTKHVCCHAWTERKRNIILLPDSNLLHDNFYWITVFELVYKLKYPQSTDTNKCLVYVLNCMLKAGMLTIDDYIKSIKVKSPHYLPLHTLDLRTICTYLTSNILRIPKSVYRYYKIFGKRLKRKYKNDQMPNGRVCGLRKECSKYDVAKAYADEICKCVKLNPLVKASDITKRKKSKAQFVDINNTKHNIDPDYVIMYLHAHGKVASDIRIYSNPWTFVLNSILGLGGVATKHANCIQLTSEYFIENTSVENSIRLLSILYHECAHMCHWRAISRHNSMSSTEAHYTNKCGATYEHQADKFAVWHLIMMGVSIEMINSSLSNCCNTQCSNLKRKLNHGYHVLFRYCRWLSYLNSKYGKLYIPADLGYIFVNPQTGKLYKPNEEIKYIN